MIVVVMIVQVLANLVHLFVQGGADGGGIPFPTGHTADEGRVDTEAASDAAEEAAENCKRRERSRAIIRLVTIHDTFQEHGSVRATPNS